MSAQGRSDDKDFARGFPTQSGPKSIHACNCMYGAQDPRCCIARAQRTALEEAHRLGREGKPLPPVKPPMTLDNWSSPIHIEEVSDELV